MKKFIITFLLIFSFGLIGAAQSVKSKRLELKRLTYDNGRMGYVDSSGAKLTVMPGKKLAIAGNLILQ
jgi:hypothetical protein